MALHTSFKATAENTRALDLLTRYGDIAASPAITPVDHNTSPGITQEDDPLKRTDDAGDPVESPKTPPPIPQDPELLNQGLSPAPPRHQATVHSPRRPARR